MDTHKYIFCNSNKENQNRKLNFLCNRDNIVYYKGSPQDILAYNTKNTIIVQTYVNFDNSFAKQRNVLSKKLTDNEMDIDEIGTAVWVPINQKENHGIIYTSHENNYWGLMSVICLLTKLKLNNMTILFDIDHWYLDKFEEQINKALIAQKKEDGYPEFMDIYYNP